MITTITTMRGTIAVLSALVFGGLPVHAEQMRASWYGLHDHSGPRNADGSAFDPYNAHTVAHKTLPFGTRLRITNPKTHKVIYAKVRDRGPYRRGFQLDVTYAGAQALGFLGTALLSVDILGR